MGRGARGRGVFRPDDNEELLGLSGWVYSDLLLGVAVVFLAAVSFQAIIPAVADGGEGTQSDSLESVFLEPVRECLAGIALEHLEISLPRDLRGDALVKQVRESIALELRDLSDADPETVQFGFMLAFGGSEDPNQGIGRARATSEQLIELMPQQFERAVSRSYWGGRSSDRVRIDLFQYITEPCDED